MIRRETEFQTRTRVTSSPVESPPEKYIRSAGSPPPLTDEIRKGGKKRLARGDSSHYI